MSTDLEQVIRADDEFYDLNKKDEAIEIKTKPTRLAKLISEAPAEEQSQEKQAKEVEEVTTQEDEAEATPSFEDFK